MTTHILGVDPGMTGALALVQVDEPTTLITYAIPTRTIKGKTQMDGVTLAAWVDAHRNLIGRAYVEQVTSRPRQAGQFQFGINTGVIHGIILANAIPMTLVPPQTWKAHYSLKRAAEQSYKQVKTESRTLASKIWPDHAKAFARVKDDGVAEASLIALYGASKGAE